MIFAHSRDDWNSLPPGAASLRSKGGGTIPMVFVTTADGQTGIQAITYDTLKSDMREADRDLRKLLETVDVLGRAGDAEPGAESVEETMSEPDFLVEHREWTNDEGTTITAAIRKVEDGMVDFLMPDGRVISYPLDKLSEESQEKINELVE